MQFHKLQRSTKRQVRKIVGRGGKRGKTSGRGMKGQKSRAGNSGRPEMRDVIKRIPKLRGRGIHGLRSIVEKPFVVNVSQIEKHFAAGDDVNPHTLAAKGIVRRRRSKFPSVKVLGGGEITKKVSVSRCFVSKSAHDRIVKAGGRVEAPAE